MRRIECPSCARLWGGEPGVTVVSGILKRRPEPGVVTVNGVVSQRFADDEFVCDDCGAPLRTGDTAAAVTSGNAPADWWRHYLDVAP